MDERIIALLQDADIRSELNRAWEDSHPGVTGGHEEGGFICVTAEGTFVIDRWPRGEKNEIFPPPHPDGKRNGELIVATFHTHPNTGLGFYQEPSPGDRTAVSRDPHLKHQEYVGEFVISLRLLYLVLPSGTVITVGKTADYVTGADHDQ